MTSGTSYWTKFQALSPSSEESFGAAFQCGGSPHLVVKGAGSEPALLLATTKRRSPRSPIRLKHVDISFDRRFQLEGVDSAYPKQVLFCKIGCSPDTPSLFPVFVELIAAIASAHPIEMGQDEVDSLVEALLEMFRRLQAAPAQSIAGLWGELLVIDASPNPSALVDAWHLDPTEPFDFAFSTTRIEVKTTSRPAREHDFSLQQTGGSLAATYIASVVLSRSAAGLSVLDLARRIAERLGEKRQEKLWRLVLESLGPDPESQDGQRFDLESARSSLVFVEAAALPKPSIAPSDLPFIREVRYRADIAEALSTRSVSREQVYGQATHVSSCAPPSNAT